MSRPTEVSSRKTKSYNSNFFDQRHELHREKSSDQIFLEKSCKNFHLAFQQLRWSVLIFADRLQMVPKLGLMFLDLWVSQLQSERSAQSLPPNAGSH